MSDHLDDNRQAEAASEKPSTFSAGADELKKPPRPSRKVGRGRIVLIGVCAVVLLAAAVWGITALTEVVVEQLAIRSMILTDRSVEEVLDVSITARDGTALHIVREGEGYSVDRIAPQVLSQDSCNTAFINASQLVAEDVAARDVTDFAQYGLDEPAATVLVNFTDGGTLTLEIGDKVPVNPYYYARVDGGDTVYQIKRLLVGIYADGISGFWDLEAFAVNTDRVVAFTIEREGADTIELTFQAKTGGFRFTQWQMQRPFLADVVTAAPESLLAALNELSITRYVATADDLAPYGLDAPRGTVSLVNDDGSAFALYVGDEDGAGNVYLMLNDTRDVYQGKAASIAWLRQADVASLISDFSNIQAINNVDALTVESGGGAKHFAIDRSGAEAVYTKDGAPIDAEAFKEAFQAVNTIMVDALTGDPDAFDGAAVDLRLTYTFTNGEVGVVEYVDVGVYHYGLRKNGTMGIAIRKEDAADMLALWRAL